MRIKLVTNEFNSIYLMCDGQNKKDDRNLLKCNMVDQVGLNLKQQKILCFKEMFMSEPYCYNMKSGGLTGLLSLKFMRHLKNDYLHNFLELF